MGLSDDIASPILSYSLYLSHLYAWNPINPLVSKNIKPHTVRSPAFSKPLFLESYQSVDPEEYWASFHCPVLCIYHTSIPGILSASKNIEPPYTVRFSAFSPSLFLESYQPVNPEEYWASFYCPILCIYHTSIPGILLIRQPQRILGLLILSGSLHLAHLYSWNLIIPSFRRIFGLLLLYCSLHLSHLYSWNLISLKEY